MYTLTQVSFTYDQRPIIDTFTATFQSSDRIVCLGPSGIGKSTLLHLLAGLEKPTHGQIQYQGHPCTAPLAEVSVVLQKHSLLPWKTASQNLVLPLLAAPATVIPQIQTRLREVAQKLHLMDQLDLYPHQLSGGQAQRVALGRALISNPAMILMDEPFSALDEITRQDMRQLTYQLSTEGIGYFLITHSLTEALYLGETILLFLSPTAIHSISNPFHGQSFNQLTGPALQNYHQLYQSLYTQLQDAVTASKGGL